MRYCPARFEFIGNWHPHMGADARAVSTSNASFSDAVTVVRGLFDVYLHNQW